MIHRMIVIASVLSGVLGVHVACSRRTAPPLTVLTDVDLCVLRGEDRSPGDPLLTTVEAQLGLGDPVDIRSATFLDPYWWFAYLKNDTRIELAALPFDLEHPPPCEVCSRSQFRYCPLLYWVGRAGTVATRRLDERGAASRTFRIRLTNSPDGGDISEFFARLNMTKLTTISQIESCLGLGRPHSTGAGSSTLPMLSLVYLKDDYVLELFAQEVGEAPNDSPLDWTEDRSRLAFTGYWSVSRKH